VRHVAYLSLGSNIGDREANLRQAIRRLSDLGTVSKVSSFYETEPVEFTDQPWFLNCAVELQTQLAPNELLSGMLQIERAMGRERVQPKGPRIVDLDILLYDELTMSDESLTVPHPAMHDRRFVLEPLAEIAPELRHPVLRLSAVELLRQVPDRTTVRKIVEKV
jgi:2-amino-4-hydroxy-6-hydroxymethyldihydropteridine diphosphokinase